MKFKGQTNALSEMMRSTAINNAAKITYISTTALPGFCDARHIPAVLFYVTSFPGPFFPVTIVKYLRFLANSVCIRTLVEARAQQIAVTASVVATLWQLVCREAGKRRTYGGQSYSERRKTAG